MPEARQPYRRVLLKLSGESLMGGKPYGIDPPEIARIVAEIVPALAMGVQMGIVIGGGNIFRGISQATEGMDRAQADYIGMLGTMMNSLALADAFRSAEVDSRVLSALPIEAVAENYTRARALSHLERGRVVIFAAGTGNPFFTTDTAAALRGAEIGAELVLKATKVDGIYDKDPNKFPDAVKFESLGFDQAISERLGVMDATAFALCREQRLPICVFSIRKPGALLRALRGEHEGTLVTESAGA